MFSRTLLPEPLGPMRTKIYGFSTAGVMSVRRVHVEALASFSMVTPNVLLGRE